MNMVVVEGGPKAVRAYIKLMTRRIRWGEDDFGDDDSDSDRYVYQYPQAAAEEARAIDESQMNRWEYVENSRFG